MLMKETLMMFRFSKTIYLPLSPKHIYCMKSRSESHVLVPPPYIVAISYLPRSERNEAMGITKLHGLSANIHRFEVSSRTTISKFSRPRDKRPQIRGPESVLSLSRLDSGEYR